MGNDAWGNLSIQGDKVCGMAVRNNNPSETNTEKNDPIGNVEHLRRDLAGTSIRGGMSLTVSVIACNIFRIGGAVVLARLLTPEHVGLVGMVTALTSFAEMFQDLGLGTATVQRKDITHDQVSTLFWINAGLGALIMLLIAGASPLISWFFGDDRLFSISIAISSCFFFGGLTVQHQALLRRNMHFNRMGIILVSSTAMSFAVGIYLAWQGFEYWALVWKDVSRAIFFAIGTWLFYRWLPGLPKRKSGIGTMLRTGQHVTGFNVLVYFSGNLGQILLGKLWGPGPVGLYKQAGQLISLPSGLLNWPLSHIMTPALSALQGEPERYRNYYRKAVSFLAFVYMPLIAYLAVYSESIIALVLGEKWMAASTVLRILALGAFVDPIASTCGAVMITCGKTKDYFRWGVISAICLTAAFSIGALWGLIGVVTAYVAYNYLTLLPLLWFSFKDTPIAISLFREAITLPALSSVIMSLLLVIVGYAVKPSTALAEIALSTLLGPALYLGVWVLLPSGKQRLIEHFFYLRRAFDALPFSAWSRASRVLWTGRGAM